MSLLRTARNQLHNLYFLIKSDAPPWVIAKFFTLHAAHHLGNRHGNRNYGQRKEAFRRIRDRLRLDNDWFTGNVPTWLRCFDRENLYARAELDCLEIGSWQGLSAYFLLSELGNARLTCVDTWEGADEHKSGLGTKAAVLSKIEQAFDANLQAFAGRVRKYKGTSFSFFASHSKPSSFDFIYVDGSHHSDDVVVDAVKCFEMLKVDGVMVFDDYFWHYYEDPIDNPAGALNMFLRLKRDQLEIIGFDYQLVIKKTADSARARNRVRRRPKASPAVCGDGRYSPAQGEPVALRGSGAGSRVIGDSGAPGQR